MIGNVIYEPSLKSSRFKYCFEFVASWPAARNMALLFTFLLAHNRSPLRSELCCFFCSAVLSVVFFSCFFLSLSHSLCPFAKFCIPLQLHLSRESSLSSSRSLINSSLLEMSEWEGGGGKMYRKCSKYLLALLCLSLPHFHR